MSNVYGIQNIRPIHNDAPHVSKIIPNPIPGSINIFNTKQNPIPPSEGSDFISIDEGNCSPSYIRCSVANFPTNNEIVKQSTIPMGIIISPFAEPKPGENNIPQAWSTRPDGPIRCKQCQAYHCALNKYNSVGQFFNCFICDTWNDIPPDYYYPLSYDSLPMDRYNKPEICFGSYECIAPSSYNKTPPIPMNYVFVLEVTRSSLELGLVRLFSESIKSILATMPNTNNRIGIVTFNQAVQFYNFNKNFRKPQILHVDDITDMFIPLQANSNLLVNYNESKSQVDYLLDNLETIYKDQYENESCYPIAVRSSAILLKFTGGKLLCFATRIPNIPMGKGGLRSRWRSDPLSNGNEDIQYFNAQTEYYTDMGNDFNSRNISLSSFFFGSIYKDLATLSSVSSMTGGQLYYYPNFQYNDEQRYKVHHEIFRNLTRYTGYDCTIKIRSTPGIEFSECYYGYQLQFKARDDLRIASLHSDSLIPCYFTVTASQALSKLDFIGIQVAVGYTSIFGERRIRIHSLRVPTTATIGKLFASADNDALVYLFTIRAVHQTNKLNLIAIRSSILDACVSLIHSYCTLSSRSGVDADVLTLPETLPLLPIYLLSAVKSILLRTYSVPIDLRVAQRVNIYTGRLREFLFYLYPRMFAIHNLPDAVGEIIAESTRVLLPKWELLSFQSLDSKGCYLVDDNQDLVIWVGRNVPEDFLQNVFGVTNLLSSAADTLQIISTPDNPYLIRVQNIIAQIRSEHTHYPSVTIVRQGNEDLNFAYKMVEDRVDNIMSHPEFLRLIHMEIKKKIFK